MNRLSAAVAACLLASLGVGLALALATAPSPPASPDGTAMSATSWAGDLPHEVSAVIALPVLPTATTPTPQHRTVARTAPAQWLSECRWAITDLAYDALLDGNEARAIANGTDPRFGLNMVAYYQNGAHQWSTLGGELTRACTSPYTPMTLNQRTQADRWLVAAGAIHATVADGWNDRWASDYVRMTALVDGLPAE